MERVLYFVFDQFSRFSEWFDRRYGWFFTNGMKATRRG